MLRGKRITLGPVREADLDAMYRAHVSIAHLFNAKKQNRIQLVIVPQNEASRRIAEKCGFQLEGTARGAFFNGGRSQDVLIYSLLRDDPRPWQPGS